MDIIDETTYKKIPLRNKKKEIIDYALVSNEDYDRVNKYKWHISLFKQKTKDYKSVRATINKKIINLSHFILEKPKNGNIIDHLNNNPLDNRQENLKERSRSENSQNKKKIITENTTSIYKGVYYEINNKKWRCSSSDIILGRFDSEIEAATLYDKFVYVKYGENASTNNLIDYKDTINLTLEDIIPKKIERNLPKYISINRGKYLAQVMYNKKYYTSKGYKTVEEAEEALKEINIKIDLLKNNDEKEHNNKEITRNEDGYAVINICDKNKKIIGYTIVDDDKWHELSKQKWCFKNDNTYVQGRINNKTITLHRYLKNAKDGDVVDHINKISYDNRINNLRLSTNAQNSYNKSKTKNKNSSSIYKGVKYRKQSKTTPYEVRINKNYIEYHLGYYNNEIQAAYAYNLKAQELFGEFANLNKIDINEETKIKWKQEIYNKWNL
jgi:hypothetical protein